MNENLPDDAPALAPTAPAPAADQPLRCWNCAGQGIDTPAEVLMVLGSHQRVLCRACRSAVNVLIQNKLAQGICVTCGKRGVWSAEAEGTGFCAEHDPPLRVLQKITGAGTDVADAMGDWHLTMAQEIIVLFSRACDVGLYGKESFDSLAEALRLSYDKAVEQLARKSRWCAGWRLWCGNTPPPADEAGALGWEAASRYARDIDAPADSPGVAEGVYDQLRHSPEHHGAT
jgi:hypothetical protein